MTRRRFLSTLASLALLLTTIGCSGVRLRPASPATRVVPADPIVTFDVVAVQADGTPISRPAIQAHGLDGYVTKTGDDAGYALFQLRGPLPDSDVIVDAPGYETARQHIDTVACGIGCHNYVVLTSVHVDPSTIPLTELATIRGAMWPLGTVGTCGVLPLGPRPNQPDNVIATVFITNYSPVQQACIIAELKGRGYTHVVMGPLVDSDGYHGIWTPNDWRGANFDRFLDAVQMFYDAGLKVVVFGSPDGWTLQQNQDAFTSLLQQPRAQRLIRIFVPHGWEPDRYGSSSCTWAAFGQWARTVLPHALILLHTVTDVDAPAGTDALCNDDDHSWNPGGNAAAWGRVVPFYHGWLTQSAAFENPTQTGGDHAHPELTNFQNWQRTFDPSVSGSYRDRFEHGYAEWPTGSAWGPNQPLLVYAGEYKAYWTFWQHRTEAEGVTWGDAAIAAGAAGYLDSGSIPVPLVVR